MSVKVRRTNVNGGIEVYKRVQLENIKNKKRAKADSILGRARMIAPRLTGALISDGRVETEGDTVMVVFGDDRVPYARRRHFENKKNPGSRNYLQKAGDSVGKEQF